MLTPARYVHRKRRESLKTLAWGLGWTVGAVWFVFSSLGNPITDLRLMLYAKTAAGEVTDTFEDVTDGDDGQSHWSSAIAYRFRTPDGRIVEGGSKGSGRLPADLGDLKAPVPVEVAYHPDMPLARLDRSFIAQFAATHRRIGTRG